MLDFEALRSMKHIFLFLAVATMAAQASTITILPLGDSITLGGSVPGGWRDPLYQQLNSTSLPYTFVGSQSTNVSTYLTSVSDPFHDGFSGSLINNLSVPVSNDLPTYHPNDVLLQVGINDIIVGRTLLQNETDITNLVTGIFNTQPTVHLYIASILPNLNLSLNSQIQSYNAFISGTLVPTELGLGKNITFVDQYANFVDGTGAPISSLFYISDPTHPSAAGYLLMANTWFEAITAPEPSSVILLGLGGIGLMICLMRRRFFL